MQHEATDIMTDQRRALLTEREREILSREADVTDNYRYSIESRVRKRLRDRFPKDIDVIREYYPEIFDELVYTAVCEPKEVPDAEEEHAIEKDSPAAAASASDSSASREQVDEMREPIEEADQHDKEEAHEVAESFEETVSADTDLPIETEISSDVWSVVNEVSASWDDTSGRLETRRKAAAIALQYAVTQDVYLGKSSDVVKTIREEYPVEGQNADTWWRKNVRDVLKTVGTYSKAHHGYAVEDLKNA
jgi:hypothetical protein